jgi:DNA recombination protein RmuC
MIILAAVCVVLAAVLLAGRGRAQRERMKLEFRDMANDILAEKSARNREEIDVMLKPFKDNIADFRERIERIYADENQQRGALRNEIKNLQELNRRITAETSNLTNALRGNSKVQGDWGEMILETILESSSLVGGIHYTTQENFRREDGSNVRPDVVLHLPGGKRIVIDSKVSLTAFVEHCSADDAAGRKRSLDEHVASVRRHVGELGAKRYQDLMDSPDFVIMFVPNEPAFMAALQADQSIWDDAYRKKVIVSSPTNLFALLKIVDDLWKRDSQSRNAILIAEEGAKLYDKFVGFVETLEGVGKGLRGATEHYERAMNQLATGSGNLIGRTEKLRKLGVKANKELSVKDNDEL